MTEKELKNLSHTKLVKEYKELQRKNNLLKNHIYWGWPNGTVGCDDWFDYCYIKDMRQVGFLQGWEAHMEWIRDEIDNYFLSNEEKAKATKKRYEWLKFIFNNKNYER